MAKFLPIDSGYVLEGERLLADELPGKIGLEDLFRVDFFIRFPANKFKKIRA